MTALLWTGTNLPRRLRDLSLADLGQKSTAPDGLRQVRDWATGLTRQQAIDDDQLPLHRSVFGQGMLLTGMPGTGKTTCAAAAACYVRQHNKKSVYFTRFGDYLDHQRSLYSDQDSEQQRLAARAVNRVTHAFLVVLDDVGAERVTDSGYGAEILETTLRDRYDTGLPTIVTTNLSSQQWTARYSPPLRSFITQACRVVTFTGPSLRDGR